MNSLSREFRELLLAKTLDYAVGKVPFYRNLLGDRGRQLHLADFPIIDKAQMASHLSDFLVLDRFPDYLITSGGTTGSPSVTFRNEEEYYATHNYFTGLERGWFPDLDSITEFTIDLFFNSNGYYFRKPPGWPIVSLTLEQRSHADVIKGLLRDGFIIGGRKIPARRMQSQNGPIRTLTGYFWVGGFSPLDYGIRSLLIYGGHVSRVWRDRLRKFWGTDVTTAYGLSEFGLGNATQCEHCGSYHYWTAWPEFLALDGSNSVHSGDAMLVLTSLIPFTHIQPRIRFLTEDLVTVTGHCAQTDQLGFLFRGRTASSVVVDDAGKHEVLLSEVEIIEVLDHLPDVACRVHSSEHQLWGESDLPLPPFRMGFPKFKIVTAAEDAEIRILIEVSYDPDQEPSRINQQKELFEDVLFAEFPRLRSRLEAYGKTLHVCFMPPGSLKVQVKPGA